MRGEAEHYALVSSILADARELCGTVLEAYLETACGGDEALLAELRGLLDTSQYDEADDLLAEAGLARARTALEQVLDDARTSWLPEQIGGYRVLDKLGQGGMGIVYEAEQESPRRRVAIKLLHPMHATPERLRRFRREAVVLGRLQHPGIARILEAGTYDLGRGPQPFFAMELVEGEDIRTHCARAALGRPERLELLALVADAVQYAHEHGVVHRDLKPDNVLVDERGQPRVLDFGIARASSQSATLSTLVTEEGLLAGTLAYMAPEQLTHAADGASPRADVYALGVLAFELLVGRLPHEIGDLSLTQAIATLTASEPPRASRFDASLRGDLETILDKALETEPEARYASAADLAADLRRHLADLPIQARPASRFYRARKFARRHRGLVAGALATLFTLLAGVVVATYFAGQAREQRDVALSKERQAIHGLLQSAQVLIDAGREREALSQLWLVPQAERGLAWHFLERATPHVVEGPYLDWRFVGDEQLVGADAGALQVYSLPEHELLGERFSGAGIVRIAETASCGILSVFTETEVWLVDLERELVLERSPIQLARRPLEARTTPDRESSQQAVMARVPEVSDDGRTRLWYPTPGEAEVRVNGVVVRRIGGLEIDEAAHIGADGRDLVVNRQREITVQDLATGALRLRHTPDPEHRASAFPVAGGVLMYSHWEGIHWDPGPRAWYLIELPDSSPPLQLAQLPSPTLRSPWPLHVQFDYPRDARFLASTARNGDSPGAMLADLRSGLPLDFAALTRWPNGEGGGWLAFPECAASQVRVSPSGRRLAVTNGYAPTHVVELDARESEPDFDVRARTLRGHADATEHVESGWIYHLAVSNDGSLIASAAPLDPLVRVWDARTGEALAALRRDCGDPGSWDGFLAFDARDERLLLTTPYAGRGVCLIDWALASGEVKNSEELLQDRHDHQLRLLDRYIEALAPGPRARLSQRVQMLGEQALVAFYPPTPGTKEMSPPPTGVRWRYLPGVEGTPPGLGVHPSLPSVAFVQQVDGGVRGRGQLVVLDTRSGAVLVWRELNFQPWCVAYNPDGRTLAIGTNEGRLLLFETESYSQQLEWRAHERYVHSIAWTPDGTRLVSASGDATLRIWETRPRVETRRETERWTALRAELATRDDLREAIGGMSGEELQAARAELVRAAGER